MKHIFKPHNETPKNEKGFALIIVVVLCWMLFAFSLSFFDLVLSEKRIVHSNENRLSSVTIAEAAVDDLMWEYNYGGSDFDAGSGWTTVSSNKVKTVSAFTNTAGTTIGSYTITVSNYSSNNPTATITASASNASNLADGSASFKLSLQPRYAFDNTVKATGQVTLQGNFYTDSYDSASSYGGANILSAGNIITTGSTVDIIDFIGSPLLKGDANTAPGGSVSDPSKVTGTVYNTADYTVPAVTVPSSLTSLTSGGSLTSDATLTTGSYKYYEIDYSGGDDLTINGNVVIYLTKNSGNALDITNTGNITFTAGSTLTIYTEGDVDLDGNAVLNYTAGAQVSSNVKIYGTSTCDEIDISGSAKFCGLIYAPSADIDVYGSAQAYGSFISSTFDGSGNASFHRDEKADTDSGVVWGYKLLWIRRV